MNSKLHLLGITPSSSSSSHQNPSSPFVGVKAMLAMVRGYRLVAAMLVLLVWFCFISLRGTGSIPHAYLTDSDQDGPNQDIGSLSELAMNRTMGFGEVIYISMPKRSDRQDAMELVASTIGVDLTMVEGVNGSTMDTKAIPDGARVRGSKLGCFRGHANAWRHIVKSGVETALILEDDIDFDPEIKDILKRFSTQLLVNNTIPLGHKEPLSLGQTTEDADRTAKSSPYGVGWDSLFLGQCQNEPNPQRTDLRWIYSDPHTPKKEQLESCFVKEMEQDFRIPADKGLRIVSPTFGPLCLQAYAVSRRGAQRLLYHLSYIGLKRETDNSVADLHRRGLMNGYTLTPPIFSRWRVGGAKDSDNMPQNEKQKANPDGRGNVGGSSRNLKGSVRLKMTLPWQDGGLLMNAWEEIEQLSPRAAKEQTNQVKSN